MMLTSKRYLSLVTLLALLFACCHGFTISQRETCSTRSHSFYYLAKQDKEASEITNNPFTKASWYAVEAFGKVFGSPAKNGVAELAVVDRSRPPSTMQETVQRLQEDNDRQYFLSGTVDELIYAPDCTFSDPFVSFQGRRRFVENLQNLGSFITKYSARPLDYSITDDGTVVETKFMVKLQLNLPWKPVLAWPWGVVCTIDPSTNLIVEHQEKWDIEPWEVSLSSRAVIQYHSLVHVLTLLFQQSR